MPTSFDLQKLNDQQKRAVLHREGPLLVIAGAGSGKTRIVTCRIASMLQEGISPRSILALTFTNKAAAEMKERIEKMTDQHVLITTFHSLGVRILRESIEALGFKKDFTIYDEDDSEKLLKTTLSRLNITDKSLTPGVFKGLISRAKNQVQLPEAPRFTGGSIDAETLLFDVFQLYQTLLKECNAVDFDDLLYLPVKLIQEHPQILQFYQDRWQYLLIDEYQDTNHAQYLLAKLLAKAHLNLFVVGDPDQSIYSWRGADIRNILDFKRDYPNALIIRLEQNYRSRSTILQAANALIAHNKSRLEKNLWSDRGSGEKIALYIAADERLEADFVAQQVAHHYQKNHISLKEMVVFYRTNAQSRPLEDAFLKRQLPYVIVGGLSFYQRREIKDILAFLRLIQSESDLISFFRAINTPKRGIGPTTLQRLAKGAQESKVPILAFCRDLLAGSAFIEKKLSVKQAEGLNEFCLLISSLRQEAQNSSLKQLVIDTIRQSGYLSFLKEEMDTYEERLENVQELIAKAVEWEESAENPTLTHFLEELSLRSSLDESLREEDHISLMTIHNGKGLEFDIAFIVGLEEELFPHVHCKGQADLIEEERRLCYVGMTRAKELLYLSASQARYLWGDLRFMRPSRFLNELPPEYYQKVRYSQQINLQ